MKETQGLIVKTAKRLFGKYGLRKTTVDDIAREARIGKGTIYHYYESKEDIFIAVVEDEVQFLKEEIMKAVATQTSPDKKLRMYILTRMKVIGKVANFYSTFKQEYMDYYGFVNKIHGKYSDFEIGVIKQFIQEGIDSGLFKVENLDLTAFTIVVAMKGLEYYWAQETGQEVESKLDTMLNVLFMGIMKR